MAHAVPKHNVLLLLFLTSLVASGTTLTCYKCTIRPAQPTINDSKPLQRLCSQFETSQKFQVDCPFSTFCMKTTYTHNMLHDKKVTITPRDCAPQKNAYQLYNGTHWVWSYELVEDNLQEGCFETAYSDQIKANRDLHCYCKGHLCNGQTNKDTSTHSDIMAVIFMFNAMKYIRGVL